MRSVETSSRRYRGRLRKSFYENAWLNLGQVKRRMKNGAHAAREMSTMSPMWTGRE